MGRGGGSGGSNRSGGFGGMGGGRSGGFGGNLGTGRGGSQPRSPQARPPRYRRPYRPMGMPLPMRPVVLRPSNARKNGPSSSPGPPSGQGPTGCGTGLISLLAIGLILFLLFSVFNPSSSIEKSTRQRQPLPAGSVRETAYLTDQANWINNDRKAQEGLEYFYDKTGVQPHLLICTDIEGEKTSDPQKIKDYAQRFYDQHFDDEGHLLLIFYEPQPSRYASYYLAGQQAKTVIDDEAGQILLDILDANYANDQLGDEEFFSQSFKQAADQIMTVHRSPWPWLIGLGLLALLAYLLYSYWQKRQRAKRQRQKETEEILSRPIETFGQEDLEHLEKKYHEQERE